MVNDWNNSNDDNLDEDAMVVSMQISEVVYLMRQNVMSDVLEVFTYFSYGVNDKT